LLIVAQAQGSKIKLDYEPSGVIVRFEFDSVIVYTDTTSLLSVHLIDSFHTSRTRYIIKKKIREQGQDTITIDSWNNGNRGISYIDTIDFFDYCRSNGLLYWNFVGHIAFLIESNKVKILDASNHRQVSTIKTKKWKRTSSKTGSFTAYRSYIDKDTKQVLFEDIIGRRTRCR